MQTFIFFLIFPLAALCRPESLLNLFGLALREVHYWVTQKDLTSLRKGQWWCWPMVVKMLVSDGRQPSIVFRILLSRGGVRRDLTVKAACRSGGLSSQIEPESSSYIMLIRKIKIFIV